MATNKVEIGDKNQELKYLGFVRIAALKVLIFLSNLYQYAKENSGPLRSGVGTVEGTVTTVILPVYEKFKDVPHDLLVFVDNKLDEATIKFDEHAPAPAKRVTWFLIQKASLLIQALLSATRAGGAPAAASYAVNKSEEYLIEKAVTVWFALDKVRAFHTVAEILAPTAAHWLEKYNQTVVSMTKKGYFGFSYLPLVPIEKITRAFKSGGEVGKEGVKTSSES